MTTDKLLADAALLITNDRQEIYGDPNETARKIGMVWAGVLGIGDPIPPYKVHAMMAALKLVRGVGSPNHEDSWIDAAAYSALAHNAVAL